MLVSRSKTAQGNTMPHLVVADRVGESLARLADLEEAEFERLAGAVEAIPPALRSPHRLYRLVADQSDLSFEIVSETLFGTMTIASGVTRESVDPDELAASLVAKGIDQDRSRFNARFARLFRSDLVQVTVRSAEVALADQKALLGSRIITDIRPVFPAFASSEANLTPRAALVTHLLQLEYQEDGDTKTFVVSMDRLDIEKLLQGLRRAEVKSVHLVDLIKKVGIGYVDIDEDPDEDERP
jgi:hypothetical protein